MAGGLERKTVIFFFSLWTWTQSFGFNLPLEKFATIWQIERGKKVAMKFGIVLSLVYAAVAVVFA